ncbi:MAG TPA: VanW family protein, partial [Dehalococcoidia bacterium]|nr:VanW family protein [Dehalococcoidia bacterium]
MGMNRRRGRLLAWSLGLVLLAAAIGLSACSLDPASLIPGRGSGPAAVEQPAAIVGAPAASPTRLPTQTSTVTPVPTNSASATSTETAVPTDTATPEPSPTDVSTPPDTFPDVLGRGQTSYAGSIPARAHNVELATKRLDGVMVPPGGIFSFNKALGPSTLDAGFQIGYGITLSNDRPRTVPSVAGGICQVATT